MSTKNSLVMYTHVCLYKHTLITSRKIHKKLLAMMTSIEEKAGKFAFYSLPF